MHFIFTSEVDGLPCCQIECSEIIASLPQHSSYKFHAGSERRMFHLVSCAKSPYNLYYRSRLLHSQGFLTRFNKIATQGAPQMAVDKEANSLSRVYSYYSKFNLCLFYM